MEDTISSITTMVDRCYKIIAGSDFDDHAFQTENGNKKPLVISGGFASSEPGSAPYLPDVYYEEISEALHRRCAFVCFPSVMFEPNDVCLMESDLFLQTYGKRANKDFDAEASVVLESSDRKVLKRIYGILQ